MNRSRRSACVLVLSVLALVRASTASAQILPDDPIVLGNGVVTLSGDISVSWGADDPGFYNYPDYEYSSTATTEATASLQRVRAALTGQVRAGGHVSMLGELRIQQAGYGRAWNSRPEASALYVRIRPWVDRAFDIQVGRVPPTFGAFTRRTYTSDNPLIGYPLGYQYLTSLRPDAIPATADDLLKMRGRGWLSTFPLGNPAGRRGVPLAAAFRWDTGVQVRAANEVVDASAAITVGTLAHPLVRDDNGRRQIAGRVAVHPTTGLVLGTSVSHGPFFSSNAVRAVTAEDPGRFNQDAWGADVEYSRGYYVLRAETIVSRWRLPVLDASIFDGRIGATAAFVEGRYKIMPGLYAAARVDHLAFSTITGSTGARAWDAPVSRVEVGAGYSLQRNLLLKGSYQFDRRDTNRFPTSHLTAVEVVFWF